MNSSSSPPSPEHQSIFGDTYQGVRNPQIPHTHPYPTRFHGPMYTVPKFDLPYRDQSWQRPPYLPTPPGPCFPGSDCGMGADASASASISFTTSGSGAVDTIGNTAITLFGKRLGKTLPKTMLEFLLNQNMRPGMETLPDQTVRLAITLAIDAITKASKGDYLGSTSALTNAIKQIDKVSSSAPVATLKSWFSQWLLEDLTRSKARVQIRLSEPAPKARVRIRLSPGGGNAQAPLEAETEESFPWLYVLGGAALVGAVGYVAWKRKH